MTSENKDLKRSRTLDELDKLNQQDRISSIQFNEPELHDFDASSVFEIDESDQTQKPKRKIFGKRANRTANVKVKTNTYERKDRIEEEISIRPKEEVIETGTAAVSDDRTAEQETETIAILPQETIVERPEEETIELQPEEARRSEDDVKEEVEEADRQEKDPVFAMEVEEMDLDALDQEARTLEEEEEEDDGYQNEFYDEEDQDLYEDRRRFLLSQYPAAEAYLEEQSRDGYHFVRQVGHKYYFVKGDPKPYYYSIDYFKNEPGAEEWRTWEQDGWKLVGKAPAKKKSEAGWFIFRNYQEPGEYKKEIENEEEKYRFFRKYANSCRSTMFLIFICMACCIVTAFLQYEFQGYLWGIIVCLVLFVIALIAFLTYGRMLRSAQKRARLLKARLRVKESQQAKDREGYFDVSESETQLESDWNTLESAKTKKKKLRRHDDDEDDDE
ncbi:DUF2812 domain-containing protein [uncultured Dubosiella sp.]|uniref:DUF2812 domain-containing protein n=3 Tax=uncultured Dubosiella sp. TaxID=1937011 RepID=UPI0026262D96|nr:DUF2812 domain-containing protein [uncultured Dubosiella sp.]